MVAIFTIMIVPSETLHAQGGGRIQFGNLKIIPGLTGDAVFDDNIYKGNGKEYPTASQTRQEEKVSDTIYHIKPGLLFNYTIPERGSLNLGWQMDKALYASETNNNWTNNRGTMAFDYEIPEGIILGLSNVYQKAEDPYGNADQYGIGTITKRWDNDLKAKAGYQFGASFRTIIDYNFFTQKYDKESDWGQNYDSNSLGIGVEARFLPRTWGFVRLNYTQKRYSADLTTPAMNIAPGATKADSNASQISAGLKWDPGAKLSGELNVGYQMKKYENEWTVLNVGGTNTSFQREDRNTWIAATAVNFLALEQTLLSLSLSRANRDGGTDTNETFDDTGIGLKLEQTFFTKFKITVGGSFGMNDYNRAPAASSTVANPTDTRSDKNYNANVNFDYQIREWLGLGLGYEFAKKNSNYEENEFTDNKYTISIRLVF